MKIKSMTVINYRSIGNSPPLHIKLGDLTVLSGTNDSGKTSFLISSYLSSVVLHSRKEVKSEYYNKLASLEGSVHYSYAQGELEGDQCVRWELGLTQEQSKNIFESYTRGVLGSKVKQTGVNINPESLRKFFEIVSIFVDVPLSPPNGHYVRDWVDKDEFASFCINFFNLERADSTSFFLELLFKELTDLLERFERNLDTLFIPSSTRDRLLNISLDGIDTTQQVSSELVEFYKEINKEERRRKGDYHRFIEFCQVLFPELEKIEIGTPVDKHIKEDLFITWTKNRITQYHPLSRSGAGITNVLYIISRLIENSPNSFIIFIDEPENGLHPKLQMRFVSLLKKLTKEFGVKVILSTHSPFIMQKVKGNDKLHLIEHNGKQTIGRPIEFEKKEEAFHALGAYLPLSLSANGIIFVEGQTEVKVLSILLNKVGLDIEKEGVLIVPLGGENLFAINPRDIKKIHEKSIVIIDSDLVKSEQAGGSIKKAKLSYEEACKNADVNCVLDREYRTIENVYPREVLAKVLNIDVNELSQEMFGEIPQIPDRKKVSIGEKVATEMTKELALDFPLVKILLEWWES
ncbi:ATP-dependent endonuclease [Bacillus sp. ISL-7]|uniref:ATP-dependent nuclease n=1 Tax=Bacillus sp. ISL-7 TaxID=2819136 RepID=UPI001BE83D18|nr:AAA family ATPase [Bacillus sp. ISL-7]MBT2736211.1 AAA family ATPase [Bacillus sp. ISL-7]